MIYWKISLILYDTILHHVTSSYILSYFILSYRALFHFNRLVGSRAGADKVLLAAGFEEKGEYYLLGREDPGLLYLVDSILEQSISVMVN
jgi:hypothetical protein